MTITRAKIRVTGKVQGVWFRQSTKNTAEQHGVSGWCRNNPDGSVEAIFEGDEPVVREVLEWCKKGPELARVADVQIEWEEPTGEFERFLIC